MRGEGRPVSGRGFRPRGWESMRGRMSILVPPPKKSVLSVTLLAWLNFALAACGESSVQRAQAFPDIRCEVSFDGSQEVVV